MICQRSQAAAMALGSIARNATPQWRTRLACSSVIDALVPLLEPGHIPRQQATLYCLRCVCGASHAVSTLTVHVLVQCHLWQSSNSKLDCCSTRSCNLYDSGSLNVDSYQQAGIMNTCSIVTHSQVVMSWIPLMASMLFKVFLTDNPAASAI